MLLQHAIELWPLNTKIDLPKRLVHFDCCVDRTSILQQQPQQLVQSCCNNLWSNNCCNTKLSLPKRLVQNNVIPKRLVHLKCEISQRDVARSNNILHLWCCNNMEFVLWDLNTKLALPKRLVHFNCCDEPPPIDVRTSPTCYNNNNRNNHNLWSHNCCNTKLSLPKRLVQNYVIPKRLIHLKCEISQHHVTTPILQFQHSSCNNTCWKIEPKFDHCHNRN